MICRRDANITKLIANGIATKDGLHKLDNILGKDEATLGDLMKAFDNLNFDPLDNESIGKSGTLNFLKFKENDNVSGLMVYEASLVNQSTVFPPLCHMRKRPYVQPNMLGFKKYS